MDSQQSGSPGEGPDLVPLSGSPDVQKIDPRLVALGNWGANAQVKPWRKPLILSDEPRDFSRYTLERAAAA
jgi:hypothetical protein